MTDSVASAKRAGKEPSVYVTPAWKLTWLRFTRHKLGVVCLWVVALVALMALTPEFFSTADPNATSARRAYIPPQTVRVFHEGRLTWPFVYQVEGQRNARTLKMEWAADTSTRIPVRLFARGYAYKLFGIIPADRHLVGFGTAERAEAAHVLGTDRLGRVLDHEKPAGARQFQDRGEIGRLAIEVHRQQRARVRRERRLDAHGVNVVRGRIRLHRHRPRAHGADREPSGDIGVGRHDHLVARPDFERT